jgi:DNA repair ATPase RecN
MTQDRVLVAIEKVGNEVAGIRQWCELAGETLRVIDARLQIVEKACTADHPPSPLIEPLRQLIAAVQEQTATLRDIADGIDAQPALVREAVHEELNSLDRREDYELGRKAC